MKTIIYGLAVLTIVLVTGCISASVNLQWDKYTAFCMSRGAIVTSSDSGVYCSWDNGQYCHLKYKNSTDLMFDNCQIHTLPEDVCRTYGGEFVTTPESERTGFISFSHKIRAGCRFLLNGSIVTCNITLFNNTFYLEERCEAIA